MEIYLWAKKRTFLVEKVQGRIGFCFDWSSILAGHVAADEVNSALQVNQVGIEQAVQVVDSSQAVDETPS